VLEVVACAILSQALLQPYFSVFILMANRNFWPFVRPQDLIGDRPEPLENPGLLARTQSAAFASHLTL
jgi:hypothetical protein